MIDAICDFILKRIKIEMPEIDDERAEIIEYGLQMLIGEVPKLIITLIIARVLGVFRLTLLAYVILLPYRYFVGGVHAKTHMACMITTPLIYSGNALISKFLPEISIRNKIIMVMLVWIFSVIVISLYAPADTENVPILRKKERKFKKIMSYIIMTISLIIAVIIQNKYIVISNMLIIGVLIDSIFITRPMYKLYGNKYGHEVYANEI
jgi:accessory gene regulator B